MRILVSVLAVGLLVTAPVRGQGIKDGDKQRLLAHLDMTESWLVSELEYQWLLMISTHSQRHILQIREIKAHASYPRARK